MLINEDQRHRFLRKIRSALWTLRGKRLAVLGLAFKGGTDDVRESPAMLLTRKHCSRRGLPISAYDPAAKARAQEILNSQVEFADSPYDAARDADALLILTEWDEFTTLDWSRLRTQLRDPIVIDGRNLYDPEAMAALGFTYYSVGRPAVSPEGPLQSTSAPRKRKNA